MAEDTESKTNINNFIGLLPESARMSQILLDQCNNSRLRNVILVESLIFDSIFYRDDCLLAIRIKINVFYDDGIFII